MASQRITRVNELLKREIAAYLYRTIHDQGFDFSAVTVTHVVTASNLRNARVFVSIRDHDGERQDMMNVLREHRRDIQQHLNQTLRLKYTPHLEFELDESIEKGDHVLNLIAQLEEEYGASRSTPADGESEPEQS
jgi:ribosome-binding factor A